MLNTAVILQGEGEGMKIIDDKAQSLPFSPSSVSHTNFPYERKGLVILP